MSGRSKALLGVALAIAVIIAGCGDDSTSGSAAGGEATSAEADSGIQTSSLRKKEFIKKASAACKRVRKDLVSEAATYMNKHNSKSRPESVTIAMMGRAVFAPIVEAEVAAIRKLGAPAGEEEEIEALLAADEEALEEVKGLRRAESIETILEPFGEATKAFRDYGFTSCTN